MNINHKTFTIGIELELTGISRLSAAILLADYFDTELDHIGGELDTYEILDEYNRVWKVVKDSSIEPQRNYQGNLQYATDEFQVEVVSPILYYNDISMLQEMVRILRVYGEAIVNISTGMHVHIGAHKFSTNNLRSLCNIVYAKQRLLEKTLKFDNQKGYRNPLSYDFIQQLNRMKPKTLDELTKVWYGTSDCVESGRDKYANSTRYRLLNLQPLLSREQKTIEFRMFNSTLDEKEIKVYIQLITLIAAQALNQKKASYKINLTEVKNDKYLFRVWLLQMGAIGDEYKEMRLFLLSMLKGNAAWRYPENIPISVNSTY